MNIMLRKILDSCRKYIDDGKVANYIPELAKANREEFGICMISDAGTVNFAGDYDKKFTMQSVVKPIILLAALMDEGEDAVRSLVGVESTGKPFDVFNYSDQALKREHMFGLDIFS